MSNKPKKNAKSPIKKKSATPENAVLGDDINAAIASNIIPTIPAPEVAARIKTKLMQRVKNDAHSFVFANQGEWKEVYTGVQMKLLHNTLQSKSFLIKMAKNSQIPAHAHVQDEESFVLEGSVMIEGIACQTGDYHYALAGTHHSAIISTQGCTLLVKNI